MYDNEELDAAVRAGVVPSEIAEKLRKFSADRAGHPPADDERFRMVSGLSEIYVVLGTALVLYASFIVTMGMGPVIGFALASIGWALSEYFVRRRRMVLPGIFLLIVFVLGNVFGWFALSLVLPGPAQFQSHIAPYPLREALTPLRGLVTTAGIFLACALYWWRFRLPLAYAAMVLAAYNLPIYLSRICLHHRSPGLEDAMLIGCGIGTFVLAMWWDMSDVYRQTRRSDIAFWLHGLAGFLLANTLLHLLTGLSPSAGVSIQQFSDTLIHLDLLKSFQILLLYGAFYVIALLIDRRALMLAGLPFVTLAFGTIFGEHGGALPVMGTVSLGLLILVTATWWTQIRRFLLNRIPETTRAQLPRADIGPARPRPVA
jgi:hypothetical protein